MPPQLRVFASNPRFEQRAKMDISTSLAAVLKSRPQMSTKEAMWTVRNEMLANNPYQPPSNGKCPINELPAEILGCIFKIGVEMEEADEDEDEDSWEDMSDEDEDEDGGDLDYMSTGSSGSVGSSISSGSDDSPLFQILASHVCRHWREVALNLHVLWTRLDFEDTLQLDKAKVFIDRAQGAPLRISIDCMFREDTDEEDHPDHPLYDQNKQTRKLVEDEIYEHEPFLSQNDLMKILDLIEPEVSHWGEFIFRVSTYGYVQALLSRLHKLPSAPLLKKFHAYHHEDYDYDDFEFFNGDDKTNYLPFHGNAPLLESAVLWGVHIDWDNSLPFLLGLNELELSYHTKDVRPSYATFRQIIKNSPDLRSLSLSLSGPALATGAPFDDEDQWGSEPFDIPSVHYLAFQYHEPQYASSFIQHFYFPNLRGLAFDFDREDYSSFVQKLLVPVQGRPKSILLGLESLKILGLPCDISTVEAMLQQLTSIKTLHLSCFGPEELIILKKLIDPPAGRGKRGEAHVNAIRLALPRIYCPRLENLTVSNINDSQIKALVMARITAGAPLQTLRLSSNDGIKRKTEEWLRGHVKEVEFFEPSDVEENDDDDDDDDVDVDDDDDDDDDESDDDEEEDEDPTLGPDGVPLPSPIAQHLRRRAGRGHSDLD